MVTLENRNWKLESRIMNKIITNNSNATIKFGVKISKTLHGGETLALIGDLGSGKTTFVKGLARGFGVKNKITSPTFVLFKLYQTKHKKIKWLIHADCYRVLGKEILKMGLAEYLYRPDTIVAIEWAEKLKNLPPHTIKIYFAYGKNDKERLIITK